MLPVRRQRVHRPSMHSGEYREAWRGTNSAQYILLPSCSLPTQRPQVTFQSANLTLTLLCSIKKGIWMILKNNLVHFSWWRWLSGVVLNHMMLGTFAIPLHGDKFPIGVWIWMSPVVNSVEREKELYSYVYHLNLTYLQNRLGGEGTSDSSCLDSASVALYLSTVFHNPSQRWSSSFHWCHCTKAIMAILCSSLCSHIIWASQCDLQAYITS